MSAREFSAVIVKWLVSHERNSSSIDTSGEHVANSTGSETGEAYQLDKFNALGEWIIGIYLHEFTNNIMNEKFQCRTRPPLLVNECR